jgi:hypothetical protein
MNATALKQRLPKISSIRPGTVVVLMVAAAVFLGINLSPQAQPSLETMLQSRHEFTDDLLTLVNKGSGTRYGWPCKIIETYASTSTQMIVDGVPSRIVDSRWPADWNIVGVLLNLAVGAIALLLLGVTMEFAFYLQTQRLPDPASPDSLTTAM